MAESTKNGYEKLLEDFIATVFVVCPGCSKKAIVKAADNAFKQKDDTAIKLTCSHCGYSKRLNEKPAVVLYQGSRNNITGHVLALGAAIDPYFHEPLWLSIPCSDDLLWAYNIDHLEFLENHIAAGLRERNTSPNLNRSIGSRLPKWMLSGKNRELVLKAIKHLKAKN